MKEELSIDSLLVRRASARQAELVSEFCTEARNTILSAADKTEAQDAMRKICDAFTQSCSSTIIRTMLENHIGEVFRKRWGDNDR